RGFGSGAVVDRLAPLAGDASTRRYARVWLTGPGAPASAVVMILADRGIALSSDELAVLPDAPSELPYVNVHRFLARLGVAIPGRELDELRVHFQRLSSFLDAQPRVLNHRDFHAWNLHVQDGRIRVIDFQDALLAPAPYDLATLLGDRDTPTLIRPALEQRLLDAYASAWAARGGAPWSRQQLWDVYVACALQKAFKVVGRFHYLD